MEDAGVANAQVLEAYRTALETRNLEIGLFWQRSNYFLVLNTAIGTGVFVASDSALQFALSLLGIVAALLWLFVNLGSKFWQARWEHRLEEVEKSLGAPFEDFFSADWKVLRDDVALSFSQPYGKQRRWDRRVWQWGVLRKPSVSLMMTYLSFGFVLFWVGAVSIEVVRFLCN